MAEIEAGYGRLYDAAACDAVVRVFRGQGVHVVRVAGERGGPHARGDGPQSRRAPRSHVRRPAAPPRPHAEVSGRRRVGFAREAPANCASVGRGHDSITSSERLRSGCRPPACQVASCSPTTPYARRRIRARPCSPSCRAPTRWSRSVAAGTGGCSNRYRRSLSDRRRGRVQDRRGRLMKATTARMALRGASLSNCTPTRFARPCTTSGRPAIIAS